MKNFRLLLSLVAVVALTVVAAACEESADGEDMPYATDDFRNDTEPELNDGEPGLAEPDTANAGAAPAGTPHGDIGLTFLEKRIAKAEQRLDRAGDTIEAKTDEKATAVVVELKSRLLEIKGKMRTIRSATVDELEDAKEALDDMLASLEGEIDALGSET